MVPASAFQLQCPAYVPGQAFLTLHPRPWKSSRVERKAIGQKYTRRSKIAIFASMTVVNFTVLPEPQK